jgi:hypothetical protein
MFGSSYSTGVVTGLVLGILTTVICTQINPTFSTNADAQIIINSKKDGFDVKTLELSKETLEKLRNANDALGAAMEALKGESKYNSFCDLPVASLVLAGGGDNVEDLENNLGVDPETYAFLQSGLVSEEIKDNLTYDAQGRVLYKNRVVRISSIEKIKDIAARRKALQEYNPFVTK